jgi:acetyl-CoA/propionyl-CoA carboxylase biotin carboxyl carrier protein
VNTRLQVEHPVSEEVTGIDLVREQFRLAEGETLDYEDPEPKGHSIEFRINGEDPGQGFLPMPGPVHTLRLPGGPGIRVDSGVTTGDVVTGAFDSLLAKLIVTGKTRQDAIERARRALKEFEVAGLPTVLPFHRAVLEEKDFVAETGKNFKVHTTWIENDFSNNLDPWSGSVQETDLEEDHYRTVVVEVEGRRLKVGVPAGIFSGGADPSRRGKAPKRRSSLSQQLAKSGSSIVAPMQATVVRVFVTQGDSVTAGDTLLVIEAMKMEQPLSAPFSAVVNSVLVAEGDPVQAGTVLVQLNE